MSPMQPPERGGVLPEGVDSNPADTWFFDQLANEAGQTRTKAAGRNLIQRRNTALSAYTANQRAAVGNKYYRPQAGGDEGFLSTSPLTSDPNAFINLISRGDDQFLQGLADDPGSGGGGNSGGGNNGGNSGGGNGAPENWQSIINQLLQNQQNQFNSTLQGFQNSAPTLSVGSASNAQGSAASRARARNSGAIVNTLSRRGRQSSARPRRYF